MSSADYKKTIADTFYHGAVVSASTLVFKIAKMLS